MNKDTFNRGKPNETEHLIWKTESREKTFTCPIFSLENVVRSSQDGRRGTFVSVHSPHWIVVIPYFKDDKGVPHFIVEQQYRHGSDSVTREFPAGLVEEGEDPLVAAKRELLEETGAVANKWTLLGNVSPNSAFMDNRQSFYLAEDLSLKGDQSLDPNEQIDVLSLPVDEVIKDMGTGLWDNGIMMMALGFFLRLRLERKDF